MKRSISMGTALLLAVLLAAASATAETRTRMVHRPDGAFLETERLPGGVALEATAGPWQREGGEIRWQHTVSPNIFSSTAVSDFSHVFAGATNGSPANMHLHNFFGDGTPQWSYPGEDNYVDAAVYSPVLAAVEENGSIAGASVHAWYASSSVPIWSQDIPGCNVQGKGVRVSDGGNVVAVAVRMEPASTVRLYHYDASDGTLLSTFDCPEGSSSRALRLSGDGSLSLVRSSNVLYVVETATGDLRWTGNLSASAEPLAFSEDGEWIAAGWTAMRVYHWDGETYDLQWMNNGGGGGWYLGRCDITSAGNALVTGWYSSTYRQNKVMWFELDDPFPIWTYTYELAGGGYQDLPSAVMVDEFGDYAVVGSWGDQLNTNPEIHVFGREGPEPIFTVDSPGSIFDADIESVVHVAGRSFAYGYATAGGKHVHANQMGSGGDLFAIYIDTVTGIDDSTPQAAAGPSFDAFPNPFNPKVTLRCNLPVAGEVGLTIHSPSGRRVRDLFSGRQETVNSAYVWDGRDDRGVEMPSGVYLANLRSAQGDAVTRLVLLR